MSSIITGILSTTVGLLWSKTRDKTAEKLQGGDVADAKVREIVVRELNDIKTKLDGLSRKDLLSSYSFLREGVELLNVCLDQSTQEDRGEPSTMPSNDVASAILNEVLALTCAVEKIKIKSCVEYESAKKRFEDARRKATEAFCNEALKIEDRIFAVKLRVVSEILENLESPKTAITGCLPFLRDLHDLRAIREIFSVYVNGGVKSLLGKEERAANVKSVIMINSVLFQFMLKFGGKLTDRLIWPAGTIELSDRSFNPVLEWQDVSSRKSMGGELGKSPNDLVLDEGINSWLSAVNSHGEIISGHSDDEIKIISRSGRTKVVKLPEPEDKFVQRQISSFAVDKDNVIHVASTLVPVIETDLIGYELNVLDDSYNVEHVFALDFLKKNSEPFPIIKMSINKNNDIIMIRHDDPSVYVYDNCGKLKHKFEPDSHYLTRLSISNNNEIMIASDSGEVVNFYTEKGNLTSTIKLPNGCRVSGIAFHYVLGKTIVLAYDRTELSYFLLCYSEAGELESTTFTSNTRYELPSLTSHPAGPVAVVKKKSITYI